MTIFLLDSLLDEVVEEVVAQYIAGLLNEGQANTALAETPGSKWQEECTSALSEQKFDVFLSKVIAHLDLVFSKSEPKDAECVANVLVHCIQRVPDDKLPGAVQALATGLVGKVDERSEERLGALLNLYGALQQHPPLQKSVLLAAAEYARRGPRLAALLVPALLGKSSVWIEQWRLDEAQSRELLIALANVVKLGTDARYVEEYVKLVTAALTLCREGDAAAITQLRGVALQAITDFVRSPQIWQADFASSPAVAALGSDPSTQPVHALFTAMMSGDLKGFKAAATPAALEAANTTLDSALSKARMVTLLALCSRTSHEEVPYSEIQSALEVEPDAVEGWVVRAIGARLLEAKIDQVRGVVIISRCTQRTFGPSEWKALQSQLGAWRDALKSVQGTIATHTGAAAAAAAAAAGAPVPPKSATAVRG